MLRSVPIMTAETLEELPTKALLGRLARLRALEDTLSWGTWTEEEVAATDGIAFKDDPAWEPAHDAVKAVLAHRENLPSPAERTQARQDRSALNKTTERRHGR